MSETRNQAQCIRALDEIELSAVCTICHRSDDSIVMIPTDGADLGKPVVLLYTAATTDEQLLTIMDNLSMVVRGPFAANGGVTYEALSAAVAKGAYLLVDYVFDRCHAVGVKIHNLTVTKAIVQ